LPTAQDGDFDVADLNLVLAKKLLKDQGIFRIFNVAKNAAESEEGGCEDVESCSNLYGNDDFKAVNIALMDQWKTYRDAAGPSSLKWEDDGPLANPSLFGGFWAAWRDDQGVPYATYRWE
jgi:hypothetical protein